jgi:hypothetical protein
MYNIGFLFIYVPIRKRISIMGKNENSFAENNRSMFEGLEETLSVVSLRMSRVTGRGGDVSEQSKDLYYALNTFCHATLGMLQEQVGTRLKTETHGDLTMVKTSFDNTIKVLEESISQMGNLIANGVNKS